KEIAKPITPPSESASKEDINPEQAQKDKDMQKNLALIAKERCFTSTEQNDLLADADEEIDEQELEAHYNYMAKIEEVPTADSRIDFEPLEQVHHDIGYNVFANDLKHYEQSESISNTCIVETDDSNLIPDSPDISHTTTKYKRKEIAKPITPPSESASKEDSNPEQAQKDKDMQKNLALIAKERCFTSTEQNDWLADADEEIDEQELEAYYNYMAKIEEVPTADSRTDFEPLE
nr:hypothetical protein [Tanacetum cinerariifolium]